MAGNSGAEMNARLADLAARLHSEVPLLPPDRLHVRMWRPSRAGLFSVTSLSLISTQESFSPPSPPLDANYNAEKFDFLTQVREFLALFDSPDTTVLREAEATGRATNIPPPFANFSDRLREVLQPGVSLQQLHFLFWVFVACSLTARANSAVL